MKTAPESPRECAICHRVDTALRGMPGLTERLSENEIEALVKTAQYAILNKNMTKGETNMSDEKYVISKASFEDFYETQDNLVSIIEKMVGRIEAQDKVIMKFGAALSELIADQDGAEGEDAPMDDPADEGADLVEEDVDDVEGEDAPEDADAPVDGEEEVPAEDGADEVSDEELDAIIGKAQKEAFEAGWKAHEAEILKKTGVPVNVTEIPAGNRPVSTAEAEAAQAIGTGVKKSLTDAELAKLTPQQLNAWLKEQGY